MNRRSSPLVEPVDQTSPLDHPASTVTGWHRVVRDARGWLVLPHATAVLVVLATTYGFAALARGGLTFDLTAFRLLMAMLGGQLAIGAVNEVVDANLDSRTKPWKPIPAGIVTRRGALNLTIVALLAMVGFSASFGLASLILCTTGTASGLVYDLWLKRSLLSWLPYLMALPLLPLWVWTSLVGFEPRLLMLYPLGAFAVIGVHLSQSVPDIQADREAGIRSVSALLTERQALALSWTATLSAPLLALSLASSFAERPVHVWIASSIVVAIVAANATLYARHQRLGIATCFPMTATSAAIMGLGWVLAIR